MIIGGMTVCKLCGVRYKKGILVQSNISFHALPRDFSRRKMWINACMLPKKYINFPKRQKIKICSAHFDVSSFVPHYYPPILKSDAVPRLEKINKQKSCNSIHEIETIHIESEQEQNLAREPETFIEQDPLSNADENDNVGENASPVKKRKIRQSAQRIKGQLMDDLEQLIKLNDLLIEHFKESKNKIETIYNVTSEQEQFSQRT